MIAIPGLAMRPDRGAPVGGRHPSAGVAMPAGEDRIGIIHIGVTGVALAVAGEGVNLGSNAATILCCIAILLLGLPHGALDLVALLNARSTARAVAVYLALAGAMAAMWWAAPGAALLVFFAIAVGHFGEDWPGPGVVAHGGALALLAAPLLFHRSEIDTLFAIIVGPKAILPLADSLLLVAPVAIAASLTGCALLWSAGHRTLAASSAASLAGMIMLPPLAGFTLSFGLFHSPRHFARGLAEIETASRGGERSGLIAGDSRRSARTPRPAICRCHSQYLCHIVRADCTPHDDAKNVSRNAYFPPCAGKFRSFNRLVHSRSKQESRPPTQVGGEGELPCRR
jgi:Brp/Blh family beta-carotene 15,15'-monooxygenase